MLAVADAGGSRKRRSVQRRSGVEFATRGDGRRRCASTFDGVCRRTPLDNVGRHYFHHRASYSRERFVSSHFHFYRGSLVGAGLDPLPLVQWRFIARIFGLLRQHVTGFHAVKTSIRYETFEDQSTSRNHIHGYTYLHGFHIVFHRTSSEKSF